MDFGAAVDDLRQWVKEYSIVEPRSAEWESEYPGWPVLRSAAATFLATRPVTSWSASEMDDLLFAIARDNEMEEVADAVAVDFRTLVAVAVAALDRGTPDARWQLAARLGEDPANREPAISVLLRFVLDPDEYVRRRALLALGTLHASEAESCAEDAWASGLEYQRIAAIHVLADVESPKLKRYLELAAEDGRTFVVAAAERARAQV